MPAAGTQDTCQFFFVVQVFNQARKIPITRDNYRPVIFFLFDHCLEDQFRITISFNLPARSRENRLENECITILLKRPIQVLLFSNETKK